MQINCNMSRFQGSVSAILLVIFATASAAPAADWRARVSPDLLAVYDSATATIKPSIKATLPSTGIVERSTARFDAGGRVQVDVNFDCASVAPTSELNALGFVTGVSLKLAPLCVVEGWATTVAIPNIAALPSVKSLSIPKYAASKHPIAVNQAQTLARPQIQSASGQTIDGSAITLMRADQYIAQTSANGAGLKIAVMSGDAANLSVIQARGELPTVQVISPSANPAPHPSLTDEGTMMLEEVNAIAPGGTLLFCGPETAMEYVQCVQQLASDGVTIITDDISYPTIDLMSSGTTLSQAVQNILLQYPNLSMFTSADNYNGSYWQGNYTPLATTAFGVPSISCPANGQTDYYVNAFNGADGELLTVGIAGTYPTAFQWADPNEQNVSNFDLYLVNISTNVVKCFPVSGQAFSGVATSLSFSAGQYAVFIGTPDQSLTGKFMKLLIAGDGATTLSASTPGSVSSFQAFLPSVMTVGAVLGSDGIGNTIEPYSALGPTTLVYPANSQLQAPVFVAPDAIYVDAVGTNFAVDPNDGFFHGTSAASPNAAAVAALIRSAFPSLTPAQVNGYLQAGATQLGGSAPNGTFGYGRVDALGALAQIPAPTVSTMQPATIVGGSSSAALPFTISGTGALKVTASPSVSWMTPVISPSNCGNGATNCTLKLTPSIGSFAPSTVQVTVTDGANRSSSTQFPVTITKPAPPAVSFTSGATQSVQVNASIAPIAFAVSGTGPITVSATFNGAPVNLTGCGSTTTACMASLGAAGTVTGPQSLNVTAQDSYGQTTSVSVTVTITNPPPPTIMITSGASQSVTVNGAIAPIAFTLNGTGTLTVTPNTSDVASITISSGCGTTTMTCTASLGNAAGSPGTASLTLTVEDSYAQSASASATVTENAAPSKSGGGALDPWVLLGLTGLVLVQLNKAQRKRE